ncbi:hypothetical protein ACQR18_17515 [Bradyrhizobium oligotrophicum]|uniref:hypothetical protein n=1 Tax=Bradyrhizobium oligotrophicum TaxID=44255 RepID=UPI003EBDE38A
MMGGRTYRFKIDAFSIDSIPMARLAEYMGQLAKLLGETDRVHFSHLEPGSAVLVSTIEEPAVRKVEERVVAVARGDAPKDIMSVFQRIDSMLAKDNAVGVLSAHEGAEVIPFPGRTRPKPVRYGPFWERGSLDGVLIRIGGKDDTIPAMLQDGDATYNCNTTRELAKRLAPHLFGSPVRVHGNGKWVREEDGVWSLEDFNVEDFEELDDSPLLTVVERLRAVEGSTWGDNPDALSDILRLRRDPDEQH